MEKFCLLKNREYEIVDFLDFEESFEAIKNASKRSNKVLLNLGNLNIDPKFLSYMLKLFRYSMVNDFELVFIVENKESMLDKNLIDSRRYFKIFGSIEEYNRLKTFSRFEVKLYDDNVYIRNLLKDELVKNGFSVKERSGLNFLKKNHDSKSNSIYIIDFSSYYEEKLKEIVKIKEKNKNSVVIVLVSDAQVDEGLKTMKYGVDSIIKRPFELNYILSIIKSLATSMDLKNENEILLKEIVNREKEITRLYNSLNEELKLASDIQNSLMPEKSIIFNNYKIEYQFLPSSNIGGDFCDFIELNNHRFAVVFADISGHGIPAALLSSMLKVFIYNNAIKAKSITNLMHKLNEEIINIFPKSKFVSMFYIVIDTEKNNMRFCKAAQEPALMYRKEGDFVEELETEGQVLGLFSRKVFESLTFEEKTVDFNISDKVLLYTDGITEETNENGEFYGLERLKKQAMDIDLEKIEKDLKTFINKDKFEDDVTLLKIERLY